MHIMEGFLPSEHCALWAAAAAPVVAYGASKIKKMVQEYPETKMLVGFGAAFIFVLSALKLPSVTGSCSHPTGTGLATILFGPSVVAVLGLIVLVFQALLLAHGGLTTLGANTFSMAIAGPVVAYLVYKAGQKLRLPWTVNVFLAACLGDLFTYVVTSMQLALAFPDPVGGLWASFAKFGSIFAVTQIPLAVVEGFVSVLVFDMLIKYGREELSLIGVLAEGEKGDVVA